MRFILLKWFAFDLEYIFPYPNNWKAKYTNNLKEMITATKKSKFVIVAQIMDYPLGVLEDLASYSENIIKELQFKKKEKLYVFKAK